MNALGEKIRRLREELELIERLFDEEDEASAEETIMTMKDYITKHYPKGLSSGSHDPNNGDACILEAYSQYRGMDWTDDPKTLGVWDLRGLNDICVGEATRAELMIPLLVAYEGSMDWSGERRVQVVTAIAIGTVREIVSGLPGLPAAIKKQCEQVVTLEGASAAARAVRDTRTARNAWAAATAAIATAAKAAATAATAAATTAATAAATAARATATTARNEVAVAWATETAAAAAAAATETAAAAAAAAIATTDILRTAQRIWLDAAASEQT